MAAGSRTRFGVDAGEQGAQGPREPRLAQEPPTTFTALMPNGAHARPLATLDATPDGTVNAQTDDAFWRAMLAGIRALAGVNFWMATRQLGDLVDSVITPLLIACGEPRDAAPWGALERQTFLRDLTGEDDAAPTAARLSDAVDTLMERYRAVAEVYLRLREGRLPAPFPSGLPEQTYHAWVAQIRPQPAPPVERVVTWRRLSLVLPAYNEQEVIARTVADCLRAVRDFCPNAEVIVVDDGSHDRTGAIIDKLAEADATVVAVHNRPNRGYGGALRSGFDAAHGSLLFFMDSDGQFDITELGRLLEMERERPDAAVLGYRARRSDPPIRKLNAWGWKKAARAVIGLRGIRDIDCAFKLLPADAIRRVRIGAEGASINAEFLRKLQLMGVPLIQTPVTHRPRQGGSPTGAHPRVILRAFGELYRLRQQLKTWTPTPDRGQ